MTPDLNAIRERAEAEVKWAARWKKQPGHFELVRVDSHGQFCADVLAALTQAETERDEARRHMSDREAKLEERQFLEQTRAESAVAEADEET